MNGWEYRFEKFSLLLESGDRYAEKTLGELGSDGWEAVGIAGETYKNVVVLLKRPIPAPGS